MFFLSIFPLLTPQYYSCILLLQRPFFAVLLLSPFERCRVSVLYAQAASEIYTVDQVLQQMEQLMILTVYSLHISGIVDFFQDKGLLWHFSSFFFQVLLALKEEQRAELSNGFEKREKKKRRRQRESRMRKGVASYKESRKRRFLMPINKCQLEVPVGEITNGCSQLLYFPCQLFCCFRLGILPNPQYTLHNA